MDVAKIRAFAKFLSPLQLCLFSSFVFAKYIVFYSDICSFLIPPPLQNEKVRVRGEKSLFWKIL
jgi:hypothetical protein